MNDAYEALMRWAENNPYADVRLIVGGRGTPGYLTTSGATPVAPLRVTIRRPGRRNQYFPVFERHLTRDYPRLEVKGSNGRYRPIVEVLDSYRVGLERDREYERLDP